MYQVKLRHPKTDARVTLQLGRTGLSGLWDLLTGNQDVPGKVEVDQLKEKFKQEGYEEVEP